MARDPDLLDAVLRGRAGDALVATLGEAPIAFGLYDREARFLQVNAALAAYSELSPEDIVGRPVGEIFPRLAESVPAIVREVAETGLALRLSNVGTPDSSPTKWEAGYWPVRDGDGTIVAVGVLVVDVSARVAAEASTERLRAVLRITDAALSTLDPAALLDRLGARVAEVLGVGDVAFRLYETPEPEPGAGGRPETRGERLVVPLLADGVAIGVVEVTGAVGDDALALLEVVADRAARALANARRHEDERRLATMLREHLVPPAMPVLAGVTIHGRLWAAQPEAEVGGDFYDVFALGEDRVAILIGEVHADGHAAIGMLLRGRGVLREALAAGLAPTDALVRLDQALQGGEGFLTCAAGVLDCDGDGCVLRLATGGAPPPVLSRAGGNARPLQLVSSPLGIRPATPVAAVQLRLAPGDTLLLYTDGLTDGGAPFTVLGPEDLAWMLGDARGRSPEGIAEHLRLMAAPQGAVRPDDIAMLVVQANTRSAS